MKIDFLNPRFLRYFIKVADLGSLVSASKDLNVSQPSITRAVQILESNLGKKLFSRSKKGMELTKEGQLFYLNSKAILSYNEKVYENISYPEIKEKIQEEEYLRFGMPRSLSTSHKENLLWILKRNYENKKIRIVEEESNTLNKLVFENKLDFAISCIPEFHKDLTKVFLYNDPFCVAFYKGHHFQNMKEIPIDEIRKEPNYIFRRTCEFFYYNYKLTHKGKLDYKIINNIVDERIKNGKHRDVIYTNSETTASHCIKTGLGVAIIPESVAIDYKLLFREVVKPSIKRDIYFIYRDENKDKINFDTKALKNALWL